MPHLGCPCACSFCNQHTITGHQRPPSPQELKALLQEQAKRWGEGARNLEIAFFGGSFTAIPREYMLSLLAVGKEAVERYGFSGLRCSTRPDAVDKPMVELLKSYGMKAVELGAQSMSDEVLEKNQRGHTSEQVREASHLLREGGLELGLQMMTGLDGDTPETALYTARELIALKPKALRIYPTLVLKGTELASRMERGVYAPQTLDEAVELCARLLPLFEEAGISVIRMGLQGEPELEKNLMGGPFHPAFRELVLSKGFLEKMEGFLKDRPKGGYAFYGNPKDISAILGQRRANVEALKKQGYEIRVIPSSRVERGMLREKMEEQEDAECF